MPRTLDPDLLKCLDRANPNVCHFVEVNAPDVSKVLRRAEDQFLVTPPLVSQAPANTIAADPAGALTIKSTAATLIDVNVNNVDVDLPRPDTSKALRGMGWTVDPTFGRAVLRTFTARLKRHVSDAHPIDVALQIYRAYGEAVLTDNPGLDPEQIKWSFVPLLPQGGVIAKFADQVWASDVADVAFDLTPYHLEIGLSNAPAPTLIRTGELPVYYFVIDPVNSPWDDAFKWQRSTTFGRTIAGVGTFEDRRWQRVLSQDPLGWVEDVFAQVPRAKIEIESFSTTVQAVYAVTLPTVPIAASTGRIVFERGIPTGTSVALELSTAGTGGPWTGVTHDDLVAIKQQNYHLRATLNASANQRLAPRIMAMGLQFRIPVDVTAEATVETIEQAIEVPFCKASIGEGRVRVVRFGRRDFSDSASELAVKYATPKLEVDVMLGSRHPSVPRSKWLLVDRAFVNDRQPTQTAEQFGLLSYLKTLKRKIPARLETINQTFNVVAGTTAAVVVVDADLPGASGAGGDYLAKGYYIRVRSSTQTGVQTGYVATIDNNTDKRHLAFTPIPLPGTLVAGDIIEVHSGVTLQPQLTWVDADPADVWWEILTTHLAIPPERIGRSDLGRVANAGLPPKVTDRAPGDTTTQDKLRITLHVEDAQSADQLIDQLSFIMGGATIDNGGQIVFRQIYPLRDVNGKLVVPAEPPAAVFDARNTQNLDTPTGLEQRITQLACDYGVNTSQVSKDTPPADTVNFVDADALAWHAEQAVDDLAVAAVPKEIARWCYNAADQGEYLASRLTEQVVRVASTGLRVWQWAATDAYPHLVVGDLVTMITDQYTDYDPARKIDIRGPWAFPLILVSVANSGRRFRGLMPGLTDAVQMRGGPGTLTPTKRDAAYSSLNNFRRVSETPTTVTYGWDRGAQVKSVWVHDSLYEAPPAVDPWPGEDDVPDSILPDGTDTYTAQKPLDGFQRFLQFEPRLADLTHGTVRRAVVQPVAPKVSGKLRAIVTNGTADLTFELAAGTSSFPVSVFFTEDNPDGTPFAETTMSAPGILTQADVLAFADRPLPQREVRRYYARIVDVTGSVYWAFASADRDALPSATVTPNDFRPDPSVKVAYDDDTDAVRITVPGGKTKVYGGLSGSGVVTYTVGDALDDTTVESAFTHDELRTPYLVEVEGGGMWLTAWTGPLHGQKPAGIAQGTVSIDANGVAGFSPDLPIIAQSYKYSYNVGAAGSISYPSDASTVSGGTLRNLSGAHIDTVNSLATLAFGESIFITVVPFTGASGTGTQMQALHMRGAYLTYTATKTATYAAAGWADLMNPAVAIKWDGNGNAGNSALGAASQQIMGLFVVVPHGVTITAASGDVLWNSGVGSPFGVSIALIRKTTGGTYTSLGSANGTSGAGWTAPTISLSESASAGRTYYMEGQVITAGGAASVNMAFFGDVSITYTMPDPKQAI